DVDREVAATLERALSGGELSAEEAARLLAGRGAGPHALLRGGDPARAAGRRDDVSFVVCRNVNFTNVCYVGCSFCGFARHQDEEEAYDHSLEVIFAKAKDAVARGATELCIQGGIDPRKDHTSYLRLVRATKRECVPLPL